MQDFIHLHVHTQYSLLDGQTNIKKLVDLGLADSAEVVVNAQGINYNYYTQRFGNFLGSIITVLVRFFTGNPI